jgi:hypothetical protein
MRSGFPTEVPPNFNTTINRVFRKTGKYKKC